MLARDIRRNAVAITGIGGLVCALGVAQYFQLGRVRSLEERLNQIQGRSITAAGPGDDALPSVPISLAGAFTKGSAGAKFAIIEYSDFQCPYCATFAKTVQPELEKKYVEAGLVLLAFRHLPLESIHPHAFGAAEAAECAGAQGGFWLMHDLLFGNPKRLDRSSLSARARELRLDVRTFDHCMGGQVSSAIRSSMLEARSLSISSTPTFLVGTLESRGNVKVLRRISGALAFERFDSVLKGVGVGESRR